MTERCCLVQQDREAADFVMIYGQVVILGVSSLHCTVDVVLIPCDVVRLIVRQIAWVRLLVIISCQLNLVSTNVFIFGALNTNIDTTIQVTVCAVIIACLGAQWVHTLSFSLI